MFAFVYTCAAFSFSATGAQPAYLWGYLEDYLLETASPIHI